MSDVFIEPDLPVVSLSTVSVPSLLPKCLDIGNDTGLGLAAQETYEAPPFSISQVSIDPGEGEKLQPTAGRGCVGG